MGLALAGDALLGGGAAISCSTFYEGTSQTRRPAARTMTTPW